MRIFRYTSKALQCSALTWRTLSAIHLERHKTKVPKTDLVLDMRVDEEVWVILHRNKIYPWLCSATDPISTVLKQSRHPFDIFELWAVDAQGTSLIKAIAPTDILGWGKETHKQPWKFNAP
jgi:hypothetical protein